MKDVRSQEKGEFVQCGQFSGTEEDGSLDADFSTFWSKKLQIFRNLWCVHTDKGVVTVRTIDARSRGQLPPWNFYRSPWIIFAPEQNNC